MVKEENQTVMITNFGGESLVSRVRRRLTERKYSVEIPEASWTMESTGYHRPEIEVASFVDSNGEKIKYGHRWGMVGPPQDLYSQVLHPERFAPLHTVAGALIDYLVRTFDVEVIDDLAMADVRQRLPCEVSENFRQRYQRVVRVTPANPDGSPVTIIFTDYPGIALEMGVFGETLIPHCGCDACDDDVFDDCETLEKHVLAVALGSFHESIRRHDYSSNVSAPERGSWSQCDKLPVDTYTADYIRTARQRLASLPNSWQPWVRRAPQSDS
jgi:hypothetical protein